MVCRGIVLEKVNYSNCYFYSCNQEPGHKYIFLRLCPSYYEYLSGKINFIDYVLNIPPAQRYFIVSSGHQPCKQLVDIGNANWIIFLLSAIPCWIVTLATQSAVQFAISRIRFVYKTRIQLDKVIFILN